MPLPFQPAYTPLSERIISSPTFRFLVGHQRKPMTIHTALLEAQSPVLRALVSGAWEEGQTGEALWESVTEETFTLFAQFLYTGDYKPPFHVVKTSRQCSNIDANESADESYAGPEAEMAPEERTRDIRSSHAYIADNLSSFHAQPLGGPANRRAVERHATQNDHPAWGPHSGIPTKWFSHTQHPWNTPLPPTASKFRSRNYPLQDPFGPIDLRPKVSPDEDYTPMFLDHARLYVLAETYDLKALKAAALNKLHRSLCSFALHEARYRGVVELVRYTYENTPAREGKGDALRELVTHYMAEEATNVVKSKQGLDLIEENGRFARDLTVLLLRMK